MTLLLATLWSASAAPVTVTPLVGEGPAPVSARYALELDGRMLELRLERNDDLVAPGYTETRIEGDRRTTSVSTREPCWYQGTVHADGALLGRTALRTCDGAMAHQLTGWLRFEGADWSLHDGELERLADAPVESTSTMKPPPGSTRWMELVVVNDAQQTAAKGGNPEVFALDTVNILNALYAGEAFADPVLVTLVGQVSLEGSTPWSAPSVGEEVDHYALLDAFDGWLEDETFTYDHVQLFTPQDFLDASLGLAHLDRMCGLLSSSIVQATYNESVTATTSAHEIGHGFGMVHDGTENTCADTFIMAPSTVSNGDQPTNFSSCSIATMDAFLASTRSACLDTRPIEGGGACGDGIVDDGEACDCGLSGCDGIDPCCDESTCQLVEGAVCSALDPCCDNACGIVPASAAKVCRDRHPDCDVAEVCDGVLPGCPADEVAAAGTTCRDDDGWAGACYDAQCASYAGSCAEVDEVFDNAEVAWSRICQPTQDGQPCGNLICSFDGQGCSSVLRASGERQQVQDGTECGSGQQCFEGVCVTSSELDLSGDLCPFDPRKVEPGTCGCGALDLDRDGDGTADCLDACPTDGDKLTPGECGCGQAEPEEGVACGVDPTSIPDEEPKGGCACDGGTTSSGWLLLPLVALGRRRRCKGGRSAS